MRRFFKYLKLASSLGIRNILYVVWYKLSIKTVIRKIFTPVKQLPEDKFFEPAENTDLDRDNYREAWEKDLIAEADGLLKGTLRYFGYHQVSQDAPPDWFLNPFNGTRISAPGVHWTELSDFNLEAGDIKTIWEASRLEWVLTLARAYAISGDTRYLGTLDEWLRDWCVKNPLNRGPNWKCGQETSIRVMHLITASWILGQYKAATRPLTELIKAHLEKIKPNLRYALAQDNNHGTSETAALYIGGSWLKANGVDSPRIDDWVRKGRKLLENRIMRLVMSDGTFSQYSVTYHRMVLNTLSWVLWNEEQLKIEDRLEGEILKRIDKAVGWYESLIDMKSGDSPNFGANDGTFILRLHSRDYREFRPALRLIRSLRSKPVSVAGQDLDEPLFWLGIKPDLEAGLTPGNVGFKHFEEGGIVRIGSNRSWLMFHYPAYNFRFAQCDFMHVDFWHNGVNLLRDAGSYSYNTGISEKWDTEYFKSVNAHNTVIFDERNPLERVTRFLYADWPQCSVLELDTEESRVKAAYRYADVAEHMRLVRRISDVKWEIVDRLDGSYEQVRLKWRLAPVEWEFNDGKMLESSLASIVVKPNSSNYEMKIIPEAESRYYLQLREIPVLNVISDKTCTEIKTVVNLKLEN